MTSPGAPAATDASGRHIESSLTDVTVVVPARDEQDVIAACLHSVDEAAARVRPIPVTVRLVLDACTDGTEHVARGLEMRYARPIDVVVVHRGCVGAARAAGLRTAPRDRGSWYATTDADTVVPPSWLEVQLQSARSYDVFVGTVEVVDWSMRPATVEAAWRHGYRPQPDHPHIHAANLGLRATTYWAAGGFADVTAHEDVGLVAACLSVGARVDRNASVPVVTSARRSSRTSWGFAATLSAMEAETA